MEKMSLITDEELVEKIRSGDRELFTVIVERYEAKMKRYAKRFLRTEDDIADTVQDVFLKTYTNLESFDETKKFSSWLYRIARNTFLNHIRASKRELFRIDFDAVIPFLYSSESPETLFASKEMSKDIDACMEKLGRKYKEVVVLRFQEGLSYEEIGDVLQIPVSTVGVRITRALKHIKEMCVQKHI